MKFLPYYFWVALALLLMGCEETIEIDLNDASPAFVIQGSVTDSLAPFQVHIARSVNFDEPNVFPPVSAATVIIRDDAGNIDTLYEKAPGTYETIQSKAGKPGRTYTLWVAAEGRVFTATSTMPVAVPFDDLRSDYLAFGGANSIAMVPVFSDPIGLGNYYQFLQYNNGLRLDNIFVLDDRNSDGAMLSRPLIAPDLETSVGDTVVVEMRCIDKVTYKYLYALDASSGNGPNASVPANPDNNFGGACLGYFSAYTVQKRWVIL